jgi:hypothetical protein
MMTATGYVLLVVAFFTSLSNVLNIRQMVGECRKDSPSSRFSTWNYLPAWWYHIRHFPNSDLRRRFHLQMILSLALVAAGSICVALGRGGR